MSSEDESYDLWGRTVLRPAGALPDRGMVKTNAAHGSHLQDPSSNLQALGIVRAEEGFSTRPTPGIRGDTVWAVVLGELDVPFVKRFMIAR